MPGDTSKLVDIVPFKKAKKAFEIEYVAEALRYTEGNVSAAAVLAEKDRKDFYDLISRTGLKQADFRPAKD